MRFYFLAAIAALLLSACTADVAHDSASLAEPLSSVGSGSICNAAGPTGSIIGACIAVPSNIGHLNEVLTMGTYAGPGSANSAQQWQLVQQCGGSPCNENLVEWVHNGVLSGWYWSLNSANFVALTSSTTAALRVGFQGGGICSFGHGCLEISSGAPSFPGGSIPDTATSIWSPVGFPVALVANEFQSPNGKTHYAFWSTNTPGALMNLATGSDNCAYATAQTSPCTWFPPSQGMWELYPVFLGGVWTFQLGPSSTFGGSDSNVFSDTTNALTATESMHTAWSMRFYSNGVPALSCSDETTYLGVNGSAFASFGGSPSGNTVWPVPAPAPSN